VNEKIEQRMTALLGEYQSALKWTRDKLKEKEEECDRLQRIILHMTKSGEEEMPDAYDP
jgi:cysteinyl-tRNA synthetase